MRARVGEFRHLLVYLSRPDGTPAVSVSPSEMRIWYATEPGMSLHLLTGVYPTERGHGVYDINISGYDALQSRGRALVVIEYEDCNHTDAVDDPRRFLPASIVIDVEENEPSADAPTSTPGAATSQPAAQCSLEGQLYGGGVEFRLREIIQQEVRKALQETFSSSGASQGGSSNRPLPPEPVVPRRRILG